MLLEIGPYVENVNAGGIGKTMFSAIYFTTAHLQTDTIFSGKPRVTTYSTL